MTGVNGRPFEGGAKLYEPGGRLYRSGHAGKLRTFVKLYQCPTLAPMHRTYLFRATCAIASLMIDPGDIVSIKGFDSVPVVCVAREAGVGPGLILGAVADGLLEPVDDLPPHWVGALAALRRRSAGPPGPRPPHLRVLP